MSRVRVVIPARLASTRLPRKVLALLDGKPIVQHVWERANRAQVDSVTIATDSEEIAEACNGFGADVALTAADHQSGTDRIAEVVSAREWHDALVVNVQGDEPFMPAAAISQVAALLQDSGADMATLSVPLTEPELVDDPNCVKVVANAAGDALYFSRSPIPFARQDVGHGYQRHVGLYAYRADVLTRLVAGGPCSLERTESLEQLRALFMGYRIAVAEAVESPPPGIDTQADLDRADQILRSAR